MARPAVKKRDIEQAAIALFATKGLARTTIKDIAGEAGVTEGALYRHYSGKNEMAWELFRQEIERFADGLGPRLFEAGAGAAARLERSVRFIFSYYHEHPVEFAFIMLTQHGFPEEQAMPAEVNPNDMTVRFVREAMDDGAVPDGDAALYAGLVMGVVLQPLVMHRYDRLRLTPAVVDAVVAATARVLQLSAE
ncbi:TetR/AcrR family transcriptional regulator [Desulfobaculum sp. SPO524]|uniref:TetR/AcrR family transcriptional regulator n=1 Tax=Desulfobaculum sp. SPO524 TaxID=3378071 RepID=UPI003854A219